MTESHYDVAIIGAGMVGSTLASLLSRVGFSVALVPLLGLAAIGSDPHGREAALKGTVMTVLGIALLGFGSVLLASRTGTTNLQGIAATLGHIEWVGSDPLMVVSLALILSGLGLFLAVVPFHMLFGDVAEGVPYPGTLLLTGGLIATGLAATTRVLLVGLGPVVESGPGYLSWSDVLQTAGLLVLIVGNSMALVQRRLKRLLACLAAGQAGMVLVTLAAAGQLAFDDPDARLRAVAGILVFLAVHAINWAGLFLAVGAIDTEPGGRIVGHLEGLARKHPWLAASVALSLLCVAGMPLTAGFFARLYLLEAMVAAGWIGTAVTVALSLGIVLVLSLGLVTAMFLRPAPEGVAVSGSPALSVVAWLTALIILALGLLPGGVFEVAMRAAASLF
jgi:NADH-quinone oxidoreductase subunit N